MKIKEYQDMMKWLTRPEKPKSDMEIQVKKSVENNKNPGTFQKLVKEDEKQAKQKSSKENKQLSFPGMEPQKKKDVFDGLANNFVKNYNLYDADPGGEMVINNNGQIMMESELKKQFEKEELKKEETKYLKSVYPKQASPEQVGQLAERLERNAQMTGGNGPFTKVKKKPEIKKPFKPGKTSYSGFKVDPQLLTPSFYKPVDIDPDPRSKILEENFKKLVRENEEEKERNANSGIGGLLGGGNNNE
jgi:hypothetical protein